MEKCAAQEINNKKKKKKNWYEVSVTARIGWLVGCFGLDGPLRQYFSLYRTVFQREGEGKEK